MRKSLADALRQQLVAVNVATMATLPKRENPESADPMALPTGRAKLKVWDAEQVRTFADAVADDDMGPAFLLAVNTGLRRGELFGLRWADVDLDGGRLHVRQVLVAIRGNLQMSTPKSGKERDFRLDPASLSLLRQRRKVQAQERLAWPGPWQNDLDLVFTRKDGSPCHPDAATKLFTRLAADAGLPRIRLHDLRHTYATLALQAAVNIKVVSTRLGHASVEITWDVYSHVLPDQDDQAAELFHAHVYGAAR